jgi:hypothetical protein
MPKFKSSNLGTSYSNSSVTRNIIGIASDTQSSGDIFLHATVDVKSNTTGGITVQNAQIKMSAAIDPYEEAKGAYVTSYIPSPIETSVIDSVKNVALRNVATGGCAKVVSTVGVKDLINRTEICVLSDEVNLLTISGVDPVNPDNSLGFTPYVLAQNGTKMTGLRRLETKNSDDITTKFTMTHVKNTDNEFILEKDVSGVITTVGVFK